ncbi:N-acetylmuramate alpha-1-phosphate uridylyltransferase MurU [Acinetobacter rathckeae]|uniref:N-acetylmuramate alpha-1-phosphate uridylyltransferase MurU n=1 Tax=Acinetobacter rathckeae TaxID=2605272 RepID=UPI0018A338EA|nr:nucleotidyltransferase family protein [Acinetobacter rathckeae]MBF7687645.1 nucleotidyltransferase family protein [Acinetobacter rathckeae]MBF7695047.1 nucleotidyltransferase family protein [Acinetobacter rathckeae]
MKAMILAAGLGNRMRPLTLHTPKPLLRVGGKPLIVWHIENLKRAGITDIIINTAWLAGELHKALGDGRAFGVQITWSDEIEGLETAGGIIRALPHLGEEAFVLVNGDVWTNFEFKHLLNVELGTALAHLMLVDNPPQHLKGDFMLCDGFAQQIEDATAQTFTYSGIAVLSPQLFAGLDDGKRPLAPLLKTAMQTKQVSAEKLIGQWVDVGTPERLADLDQRLQS